ncbi:MAG: galactose-1-phosphate uridylyltransferase [Thermodesulfovibrionales bacterium]
MPELRQDPFTHDWVIFSRERGRRPDEYERRAPASVLPERSEYCPFCPGNEHMTPGEVAAYDDGGSWRIRVVPNKFAALRPEGDTVRQGSGFFRQMAGYGRHEVVIESPAHNRMIPHRSVGEVEDVLRVYRDRYHEFKKDPEVKVVIIFKNHGKGAGTSLLHPHSQMVAAPVVPPYIRRKFEVATMHFDNMGRCLYCDVLEEELRDGRRIVLKDEHLVALHPYASHYAYETWIMPTRHRSSFGDIAEAEISALAVMLKTVLTKLYRGLGNPDYNLVVHTSPVDDEHKSYYSWHIQIVPRLSQMAGFELGSGININSSLPEETAEFMRRVPA